MAKENLTMSLKEADRLGVMRRLDNKELTLKAASEQLGLCLKQTRRIYTRYQAEGPRGLIHRKKGRASSYKTDENKRRKIVELIEKHYFDFGPTLASEKLEERHQVKVSVETIRQWMIEEGIWKAKKKKQERVYQRRERRSRFGELLQGDGSPHDWLEGRGEKCTLLQFVDDATSKTTVARFFKSETTEAYLKLLEEHLKRYGRPLGLYVDKHVVFRVNREEVKKGSGVTHFGKVMKELDIDLICANSPQAKGRVERKNGVLQDRLIKEMRLSKISTMEEANLFLPAFLEKLNKKFGREPTSNEDAHRPLRPQDNLEKVFARKERRKLSKELMFQYKGVLYLIETKTPNRLRHVYVEVINREGKEVEVEYKGESLKYKKWSEKVDERPKVIDHKEVQMYRWGDKERPKPRKHHPWR